MILLPSYDSPNDRPVREGARIHPVLRQHATSIWTLDDRSAQANDQKRVNILAFGALTASPTWGYRRYGPCLTFDGLDTCEASITSVATYPFWMAGSFVSDNNSALQSAFGLGTSGAVNGGLVTVFNNSGSLIAQVRAADGGTTATVTGPTHVAGSLYHCAVISFTASDHRLYVNGLKYTSTTNVGALTGYVNASIGELKRNIAGTFLTGGVYWAAYGTRSPGEVFLRSLTRNPWPYLYAPDRSPIQINTASAGGFFSRYYYDHHIGMQH